jgi:hypothetical protein
MIVEEMGNWELGISFDIVQTRLIASPEQSTKRAADFSNPQG